LSPGLAPIPAHPVATFVRKLTVKLSAYVVLGAACIFLTRPMKMLPDWELSLESRYPIGSVGAVCMNTIPCLKAVCDTELYPDNTVSNSNEDADGPTKEYFWIIGLLVAELIWVDVDVGLHN